MVISDFKMICCYIRPQNLSRLLEVDFSVKCVFYLRLYIHSQFLRMSNAPIAAQRYLLCPQFCAVCTNFKCGTYQKIWSCEVLSSWI